MSNLPPAIIGVGNVLMRDDGAGPKAVDVLRRRGLDSRAVLIDAGLAFSEVLCDLQAGQPLGIIDAVAGGGRPGSIYQLNLTELTSPPAAAATAMSLHEISVIPALRMQAIAGYEFTDVTIFGIEPATIAWGEGLSGPVADAVERLVQVISRYLDRYAGPGTASPAKVALSQADPYTDTTLNKAAEVVSVGPGRTWE
ncbi:MAG: hydrogenase maturation protease [Planctomycetes bacterium]|nr:hydrogenase maturation protease [Planctomycetota bacterium]